MSLCTWNNFIWWSLDYLQLSINTVQLSESTPNEWNLRQKKTCAPTSQMYSLALLAIHRYCPYSTVSPASSPVRSISSASLLAYLQQSAAFAGFDHHVWQLLHPWSSTEEVNNSERLQVLRHTAGRRRRLRIHFVIKRQNLDKTKGDIMGSSVNTFRRKMPVIVTIGQYTG